VEVVAMTQLQAPESPAQQAIHQRRVPPFWRHFFQMLGAMAVGMIVTGAIFLSLVGFKTWDQVTVKYPAQALLAVAVGMTVPMAAWMSYRHMGRRNTYEMSAVMLMAARHTTRNTCPYGTIP